MSKDYKSKRDFSKTPEPQWRAAKGNSKNRFVIQKHDASSLHYDFRLEIDGALKSWAVPKGLSTAAGEKRLAVRTEDHPIDYAEFEGVIPEDEYGGGTVLIWDRGSFEPLAEDSDEAPSPGKALEDGALKFTLNGNKLKGGYALVRTRYKGKQEQWLIFKLDDDEADARRNPVSTQPDSVASGRSLEQIAEQERPKDET